MSALLVNCTAAATRPITGSSLTCPSSSLPHQKARRGLAVCSRFHSRSIPSSAALTASRSRILAQRATARMAESQRNEEDPKNFRYVQLWVSKDGESHIKECKMSGFTSKVYSSLPQFVRDDFGGQPQKMIFTELSVGLEQALHTAPQVQFVITLSGSWYIKTTDGAKHVFKPGDILFQDNTDGTPAVKHGQHFSGAVGDVPCQQFIVQFDRPPEVDNPNPF